MKISARNQIVGKVININKGQVAAKVKIEVTAPATVTAVITVEAIDELDIKPGDTIEVVVKATEVMVAKVNGE
ncbi:MAG: molybdopterin-binding protein [Promethearchaeota archaeon]